MMTVVKLQHYRHLKIIKTFLDFVTATCILQRSSQTCQSQSCTVGPAASSAPEAAPRSRRRSCCPVAARCSFSARGPADPAGRRRRPAGASDPGPQPCARPSPRSRSPGGRSCSWPRPGASRRGPTGSGRSRRYWGRTRPCRAHGLKSSLF